MDLNNKRIKGSHHLYEDTKSGKTVVVPIHRNKDLPKGIYYGILKQAGIEKYKRHILSAIKHSKKFQIMIIL